MIDPALLKHLDNEQQVRLRTLETFFDSEGWKVFVENAKVQLAVAEDDQLNAPNWDWVLLQRGKRSVYQEIVDLEATTANEFQSIAETIRDNSLLDDEHRDLESEIEYE